MEEHGKYKEIIPLNEYSWWMATPYETQWPGSKRRASENKVWVVEPDGSYRATNRRNLYAFRPVLHIKKDVMVTC